MSSKRFDFEPITLEQIGAYADASGDHNRIHLDENFAREAGLPGIIAHGMLSMGLASRALDAWGYDLQKLAFFDSKFKDKVLPGDRLYAEMMGEPTNVNNIARMVKEELEELGDKLQDTFGKKHKRNRHRSSSPMDDFNETKTSGLSIDWKSRQPEKVEATYNKKDFV